MSCSEKKQRKNNYKAIVATILLSCLIGTYLDLLFVSKQMYAFPMRPFPHIFTINIAFTLFILPISTALFVWIMKMLPTFSKIIFIILIGLCMSISERFAEQLGWFTHNESWHHFYSIFGYMIFLLFIWKFYRWFQ
ncbi:MULTISPECIES: CBO0543 family protein [unclassified Bacillus (in: firmicutes)]|uniref:CBO0543 family protein n=1 Tax=unclassified Bacillus (in: firmicutes) TaxID=185979 RepID=UPI000B85D2E8|nr:MULTISPECIES: CBO0543 family protein [unclassified Bacillus (in: firmicutes)]